MLSDKEKLKVLAEAIIDRFYVNNPDGSDYCNHCGSRLSYKNPITHEPDCPVLLAEEVLNNE